MRACVCVCAIVRHYLKRDENKKKSFLIRIKTLYDYENKRFFFQILFDHCPYPI